MAAEVIACQAWVSYSGMIPRELENESMVNVAKGAKIQGEPFIRAPAMTDPTLRNCKLRFNGVDGTAEI